MGIVNSRFTKMAADTGKPAKGDLQVSSTLPCVTEVKIVEIGSGKNKKETLVMAFDYETTYKPIDAFIKLSGELVYLDDNAKKIAEKWKKDKKLDEGISIPVLNYLFRKCAIESVKIADDLQLPVPVQLPEIRAKEK
ncbi:MAG: hypothetical protein ACP5E4_02910 [Candidatus Aenigmatarchaeota archaeon]